jgi:phosphoribosylglycinamide formyltransferase-1
MSRGAERQGQIHLPASELGELPKAIKTAILVSNKGSGTNLQAVIDARASGELPLIDLGLVLSDAPDAYGLVRASNHGIENRVVIFGKMVNRDQDSQTLATELNKEGIGLAVMAGWSRILTQPFFEEFQGAVINIHPGGLPEANGSPYFFPDGTEAPWNQGQMTESAVQNFLSLQFATSTVHVATVEADLGPVIQRTLVAVSPTDTVDSLYDRMKKEEWAALIRALKDPGRILEIAKAK